MATILPLPYKYYGTEILLDDNSEISICAFCMSCGDYEPSCRELERAGITLKQWRDNLLVLTHDGIREARELVDGNHCETQKNLDFCNDLVELYNNKYSIKQSK